VAFNILFDFAIDFQFRILVRFFHPSAEKLFDGRCTCRWLILSRLADYRPWLAGIFFVSTHLEEDITDSILLGTSRSRIST
jgi:hypothetical protein